MPRSGIGQLDNPIMEYAWGSRTALAELLGTASPSATPQAELWIGAHPKAPSKVLWNGNWGTLDRLIEECPETLLGPRAVERHGATLPFLFKVLAAGQPLSIQAHPSLTQARAGFTRENETGIPLTAPQRNYRDNNHKPELICALQPFWALCGFRPPGQIKGWLERLALPLLSSAARALQNTKVEHALRLFLEELLGAPQPWRSKVAASLAEHVAKLPRSEPEITWAAELCALYPTDIGVLAPFFLNLVKLTPGEALFLGPGVLHAYLDGLGVELMANSDNVLRGGLTPKHVDVPELLSVLDFTPTDIRRLRAERISDHEEVFVTGAEEFQLSVVTVEPLTPVTGEPDQEIAVMLCTEGRAKIQDLETDEIIPVARGGSALIAAGHPYRLSGAAVLHKASVPNRA